MSLFNWGKNKASVRKTPRSVRLQLEQLEDRLVPTATAVTVAAGDVATLINDITTANSSTTPTTINLTASTYDFTSANNNTFGPNALPVISGNITINGNGAVLTRDASLGQNSPFRFFYVSGSQVASPSSSSPSTGEAVGSLTLENLTLEGGLAQGGSSGAGGGALGAGGAIFNQGNLTLNGVTVAQNVAEGGSGGTGTAGGGGGMGQAGQGDNGGGSSGTSGTLGVGGTGSSTGNGGAGGIGAGGGGSTIASTSSTTYSGGAGGFGGGGGSGVSQGGAGGFGGGGGSGSTVGAGGFGAGAGNGSTGGGGLGAGGAIFNMYGTTMLINTTLASNLAEGGQGGVNGDGYGGGVFNLDGTLNVVTSTLANNSTTGSANAGGAVYNLALGTTTTTAGATQGVPSTVTLADSILANSIGSDDLVNDQNNSANGSAVVNATMPNIVMTMSTLDGATTNGTPNTANPNLGLLLNYGGPTPTMPLLAGSPALGAGAAGANVPSTDQRGTARGNVLDLGAYQGTPPEAATTTLTLTGSASTTSSSAQSVTLTATVAVSSGGATPTGTVQFVDTTSGATLGSAAVTVVNGQAQATLTSTSLAAGSNNISATYVSSNGLGQSTASTSVLAGSSSQQWLNQVYEVLLKRPIDPTGLAYWSNVLASSSPTQVAYDIMQTSAYQTVQIQGAYQKLLGVAAPSTALNYLLGLMSQGTNFRTIEAIIAGSTPFYQASGGTNTSWLNAVYENFLNRPLDATGQAQWGAMLISGFSPTQIVLGIMSTPEYLSDMVEEDYLTYLGRPADPTSLAAFVSSLTGGSTNNDMIAASLIGSSEFVP